VILADIGLDRPGSPPSPPGLLGTAEPTNRGPLATAKTGKGVPYLKGVLGEAAAAAAKTDTFLGAHYRRLVKRRGKLKALVGVARSILIIVWHLLADPTARYHDLGADFHRHLLYRHRTPQPQPCPTTRDPRLQSDPRRRLTVVINA
jgi:transposase